MAVAIEEQEGERTRFPCLASLRKLVATVVTALAVVVVVMVILVLHRPEEIVFTSYGYVQSQDEWWTEVVRSRADQAATNVDGQPDASVVSAGAGGDKDKRRKEAAVLAAAGRSPNSQTTVTQGAAYTGTTIAAPAKQVMILLIMFAYNPSGRGKVDCNITSITVADMPTVFFTDMTEIMTVDLRSPPVGPVFFSVRPQSWHRDRRPEVKIDDPNVLYYLYDRHRYQSRFRVMTQVSVTYKPLHSGNDKWINATYYCWPVYFVYGPQDIPGGEVLCKTAEQMDSAVSLKPAPPAAPAPPAKAPPGGPRPSD